MLRKLLLLAATLFTLPSFAQFVTITDTGITNAAGDVLTNGTECFTPVNAQHLPMAANYPGGTITKTPKCSAIVDGVMTPIQLVKSSVTNPLNLCYMRTITDSSTGRAVIGPADGFACVQPTVNTNMNGVAPSTIGLPLIVTGPAGHDGSAGPAGAPGPSGIGSWRGNYVGGTSYALGDGVHGSDGSAYVNILACSACSHDPVSSPTYWSVAAMAGATGAPGASGGGIIDYGTATLPDVRNVLDYTKGLAATILDGSGNLNTGFTGYFTTPLMFIGDATHIVCTFYVLSTGLGGSGTFYAADKTFLSNTGGTTYPPGTPITVPAGAAYFRTSLSSSGFTALDAVVTASSLPSTFIKYGSTDIGTVNAAITAAVAPLNATIATLPSGAAVAAAASSTVDFTRNLLDPTQVLTNFALDSVGVAESGFSGYSVSPYMLVSGASQLTCNWSIFGNGLGGFPSFYDINKTFISRDLSVDPHPAGTPIAIPSGAYYFRFGGTGFTPTIWAGTGCYLGSSVPVPFTPFLTWTNVIAGDAAVSFKARPYTGTKMLVIGDSIAGTNFPAIVAAFHGITYAGTQYPSFTDRGAYASGTTYAAGDQVYSGTIYYLSRVSSNTGNTPASSPTQWLNVAQATQLFTFPGHPTSDAYIVFAALAAANPSGPSIAQQLANALSDKDELIVEFGTNDPSTTLGALGDTPVAPGASTSLYGSMELVLQTAHAAVNLTGRAIRIFVVTPYHNSRLSSLSATTLAQVTKAWHDVAGEYGDPVIDSAAGLSISRLNWCTVAVAESASSCPGGSSPFKLSDTVHPQSPDVDFGMFIAHQMLQYAQQ